MQKRPITSPFLRSRLARISLAYAHLTTIVNKVAFLMMKFEVVWLYALKVTTSIHLLILDGFRFQETTRLAKKSLRKRMVYQTFGTAGMIQRSRMPL